MDIIKKILIADDLKSVIEKEESFFNRENIKMFTSSSNEEAFSIHKKENVNIIITHLDTPQMDGETLCSLVRNDNKLRRVSIIIVCSNIKSHIERLSRCRANEFIYEPTPLSTLCEKAYQLLNIAQRESLRAPVFVKVQGEYKGAPFLCISQNISVSGMLFQTDRIIHQGDNIICSFFLPNSVRILSEAAIVRVVEKKIEFDPFNYGIKFLNLAGNYTSSIEEYVKEKLQRQKEGE